MRLGMLSRLNGGHFSVRGSVCRPFREMWRCSISLAPKPEISRTSSMHSGLFVWCNRCLTQTSLISSTTWFVRRKMPETGFWIGLQQRWTSTTREGPCRLIQTWSRRMDLCSTWRRVWISFVSHLWTRLSLRYAQGSVWPCHVKGWQF